MRWLALVLALGAAPQEMLDVDTSFQGSAVEAMEAIRNLAEDEPERAFRIAEEFAADEEQADELRAEFRFAQGVLAAEGGRPSSSIEPFLRARALAGPGELRGAATYNQGTAELLIAESRREEAFQQMLDPAAAGAPSGVDAEDPLAAPRRAYLRAKETLVERLLLGGGPEETADTRANLELIQRRLRELDELDQQEEEPPEEEQDEEQQEGEDGEDGEEGEEGEESSEGEEESEGEEQQDSEGEPEHDQQGDEQGERQEGEDPDARAPEPESGSTDELPDVQSSEAAPEPAERHLSREEAIQLLDKLSELEEELEALNQRIQRVQRVPVEKDW